MNLYTPLACRDCGRCSGCGSSAVVRTAPDDDNDSSLEEHKCPHGLRCQELDANDELLCGQCEAHREDNCGFGCTLVGAP